MKTDIENNYKSMKIAISHQIKKNIIQEMETLFGGGKDLPVCNEENEEAVIDVWNEAVNECLKIVKEAL
jgi:hypothetical protein